MSLKRRQQRAAGLPPGESGYENMAGRRLLKIRQYEVASYYDLPDVQGAPSEVHFRLHVDPLPMPLVVRLKTPVACDTLIAALERSRYKVWPLPEDMAGIDGEGI
jgi:hypothetical protein